MKEFRQSYKVLRRHYFVIQTMIFSQHLQAIFFKMWATIDGLIRKIRDISLAMGAGVLLSQWADHSILGPHFGGDHSIQGPF